jgi:glycosyltransferase involved in cell wall biosynthesis
MAIRAGKKKGAPVILHLHGGFDPQGRFKRWAYALYDEGARRGLTNQFDHFLGLNPDHLSRLENLGVPPDRMTLLPNALADTAFLPGDPTAFREAHRLRERRIVLFLGSVNHAKRCDLLVRAWPRVMQTCPEACLVLAGPDGGEVRAILALSRELALGNACRWIGPLHGPEKRNALAAADVVALPSDEDAAPMVLLEALAQGTPVLASSAVGTARILADHGVGLIFDRGNVLQLADLLVQALKTHGARGVTGPRTAQMARKHFSLTTNLNTLEELYHHLIRQAESAGHTLRSNLFLSHSPRAKG